VAIENNTFTLADPSQAPQLVTVCTGMAHAARFGSCTNVTQRANAFLPLQKEKQVVQRRIGGGGGGVGSGGGVLAASFERPSLVHRSYGGQHAWFSSVLAPGHAAAGHAAAGNAAAGNAGDLLAVLSLGGDGTPCPPPGKPPQNCSMTLLSSDAGRSWAPLTDWSAHSPNEILPLPNGSFVALPYGAAVETGPLCSS